MSFNLSDFIVQSNLIDPQPNFNKDKIIPGAAPGDRMYDNQLDSYNLALEKVAKKDLVANDVLAIHKALTKRVDFFSKIKMSGKWRQYDVYLTSNGTRINFPPNWQLYWLMNSIWTPFYADCMKESLDSDDETKARLAYEIHDLFECIHPFIDGNGRTGRILLNAARLQMGLEPIVIFHKDKDKYFTKINRFRFQKYDDVVQKYNKLNS